MSRFTKHFPKPCPARERAGNHGEALLRRALATVARGFSRRAVVALALAAACSARRPTPTADPVTSSRNAPHPPAAPPRAPVQLVEMRNESSTLVTFRVVLRGGSADDPAGREGLTRLLARLMAEGGTRSLTYEELTRRLFPMAADLDYRVDRDLTVITGQVHRDHVTEFYPLLRDVVIAPRLAEEDFRRVKTQSLADLRLELRGSDDETLGKEVLQGLVYQNHPYGHPPVGTERGLEAVTLDEVRAHHRRLFCPSRIVVGLAGAYPAALADTVRADLGTLPGDCAPPADLPPPPERPAGLHVVIVDKPAASSTAISLGFALTTTRQGEDHPALYLATSYLGLHRQSVGLLYQTLREARGLNYGDYAYAEHFEQEGHTRFPRPNVVRRQQYASVWLRPVPSRAAHFALRAGVRALDRTVREGVAQADLERVRGFLDGYVGLYTQTESARLGFAIDDALTGAQAPWAARMRSAWGALTPETLRAAVQRNLTARDLWVAIVSPDAQALARAIGSNAPSPITYDSPKPAEVVAEDREIAAYPLPVRAEDVRVVPLAEVFR